MYDVERIIGQGAFSVVCKAKSKTDNKVVALKKVHLSSMNSPADRMDCLKEISLLQQLDHPNVIRYITSYIEGNDLNIVLELANAGDLSRLIRHFLKRKRLIPERTIWKYFVQIASGLHHMHSKRIMHRDIKPANVFVTREGVVKLGDLGLGRYFSAKTMAARSIVGTPYYMSPERITKDTYTFSSDIWSLGCLLHELAALRSPFYEQNLSLCLLANKIENADYNPIPSNIYTKRLRLLVDECLQTDPTTRPDISYIYDVALYMSAPHAPR